MKRILCTSIVLIMLLTACSAPVQQVLPTTELSGDYTYGVYELDFHIERMSGCGAEMVKIKIKPHYWAQRGKYYTRTDKECPKCHLYLEGKNRVTQRPAE